MVHELFAPMARPPMTFRPAASRRAAEGRPLPAWLVPGELLFRELAVLVLVEPFEGDEERIVLGGLVHADLPVLVLVERLEDGRVLVLGGERWEGRQEQAGRERGDEQRADHKQLLVGLMPGQCRGANIVPDPRPGGIRKAPYTLKLCA